MLPGIRDFRADILNTSTVKYLFPAIIKTVCLVNVRYFPFDTQICEIKLGSWSHHGLDLDIISGASGTPTILLYPGLFSTHIMFSLIPTDANDPQRLVHR